MRRYLSIILTLSFLFITFAGVLNAQEIKRIGDIKSVKLVIYENLGAVGGYIIFRDNNDKPCALDYYEAVELKCPAFEKEFKIDPNGFKYLKLRNGDEVFAYPIEDFVVEDLYKKFGGERLTVEFKLGWLKTTGSFLIPGPSDLQSNSNPNNSTVEVIGPGMWRPKRR